MLQSLATQGSELTLVLQSLMLNTAEVWRGMLQSLATQGSDLTLVLQSLVVNVAEGWRGMLPSLATQGAELTLVLQSPVTFVTGLGRKRSGLRPEMLESVEQRTRRGRKRQQIACYLSIK